MNGSERDDDGNVSKIKESFYPLMRVFNLISIPHDLLVPKVSDFSMAAYPKNSFLPKTTSHSVDLSVQCLSKALKMKPSVLVELFGI